MKKQFKLSLAVLALSTVIGTASACDTMDMITDKLGDLLPSIVNPNTPETPETPENGGNENEEEKPNTPDTPNQGEGEGEGEGENQKQTYTVKFVDYDGTEISSATYEEGATVVTPANPTRDADTWYTYAFAGWDSEVVVVAGNATYTATYTPTAITYTVTFLADDATVDTKTYSVDDMTVTAPEVPTKAHYTGNWESYTLTGGNVTVNAVYVPVDYTVTFLNADGSVLSTKTYHYGDTVTVPTATKASDKDYDYTFKGWDTEVVTVAGNATYTAEYTPSLVEYEIVVNYDDGTTQTIIKTAEGLSATPSKGYNYSAVNGVAVAPYVEGKKVELSEDYFMSLYANTEITYSYVLSGLHALNYNATENRLEATTATADKYSEILMSDKVSGDFELSVDVKWTGTTEWPVVAFGVEDENGESVQFIAGRIYVGCQANWGWINFNENAGNPNFQWCRTENGWPWTNNRFGTTNAEGGYDFTYKVIVDGGVAAMYIDNYYITSFTLSNINSAFDVTDSLTVKTCVREVKGSAPAIYMSNWNLSDDLVSTCTISFKYLDGTTENITKTGLTLEKDPTRGYNYTSDNGVKVFAYVDGKEVTVNEAYLKSLSADTTITYNYKQSGEHALVYNATEKQLEATTKTSAKYSEVLMADTVSGDFEMTMDVSFYSGTSWPIVAFSLEDASGDTIQLIFGRIYVGCQKNWAWANFTDSATATANFKWCRKTYADVNGNAFPWKGGDGVTSSNDFGNPNATGGGCTYTAKVVVTDGIAKMYVGYYTTIGDDSSFTYVYCHEFNFASINSNFNVNDELKIKLCVREVNGTSPKIVMSNWAFTNKEN